MSTENNDAVSTLSSNSREASPPTAVFAKYIVILLAVSLILVLFGIKPSLEGYFSNNTKVSQQVTTNEMNKATFDDLRKKQANLSQTQTDVDLFLKSFPAGADQKKMLDELNRIAAANGVSIGSITPTVGTGPNGTTISASDLVAPINIDLTLTGGDPNGFLAALEKSERVFTINSLSYTNSDKGEASMSIKATTFVIQPLVNPNAAPDASSGMPVGQDAAPAMSGDSPSSVSPDSVPVAPSQ